MKVYVRQGKIGTKIIQKIDYLILIEHNLIMNKVLNSENN